MPPPPLGSSTLRSSLLVLALAAPAAATRPAEQCDIESWNDANDVSQRSAAAPPSCRTPWLAALAAATLGGASAAHFRRRIGHLERAHAMGQEHARQLIEAQEKERRRIAAELHDSLGQELVVIRNWALLALGAAGEGASPAAPLREISDRAAHALDEVREIAYNFGLHQLDRNGLTRTLVEMIERVAAPSGIAFQIDVEDLDSVLPKESEVSLYRVLQEAVTNTVKHSGASTAWLSATLSASRLGVSVGDNGCGFVPGAAGRGRALGLTGMAERVRLLGGTLSVRSAPGEGAAIDVEIPLRQRPAGGQLRRDGAEERPSQPA